MVLSTVHAEHVNVAQAGSLTVCVRENSSSPLLLPFPIGMSNPVPLRAFFGGVGIALASYNLLLLNGSVFGISGFIHRCYRGTVEPAFSVGGLILGGVAIGALRSTVPPSIPPNVASLPFIVTSGFLVGLGTKVCRSIAQDDINYATTDAIISLPAL